MSLREKETRRPTPRVVDWRELTPPSRTELQHVASLLLEHTGLQSEGSRENFLSVGILRRMGQLDLQSIVDYIRILQEPETASMELEKLAALLLVHKTSFFRDRAHFDWLEQDILPRLKGQDTPLRIWSAGCSTGQEVYSLAISLRRCGFSPDQARILGSDLSVQALDAAREGIYPEQRLSGLRRDENALFDRLPDGRFQVSPRLVRYVEFRQHNLVELPLPSLGGADWDIIFCRNVLIYFNRATIRSIIRRFHRHMGPQGVLFLGSSESLFRLSAGFTLEQGGDSFIYRKAPRRLSREGQRPLPASTEALRPTDPSPGPRSSPGMPPKVERVAADGLQIPLESLLEQASKLTARGELDAAQTKLLQALEHWPAEKRVLSGMGEVAFEKGALEEARSWLSAALQREPLDAHNLFLAGLTLFRLGLDQEAAELLRRLLYLERNFALGHYYQGLAASRLGDSSLALRCFRNTLASLEKTEQIQSPRLSAIPIDGDLIRNACRARMEAMRANGVKGKRA